jgi:hypothetical protein
VVKLKQSTKLAIQTKRATKRKLDRMLDSAPQPPERIDALLENTQNNKNMRYKIVTFLQNLTCIYVFPLHVCLQGMDSEGVECKEGNVT